MKKSLFALCLCVFVVQLFAAVTPVQFPVQSMFGGAAYNKPITVTAVNTLITDGHNVWAGTYTNLPASTNTITAHLYPNDYLLTLPGVVKPARFTIFAEDGTNVVNVVDRLTSGPLFYFGTNGFANLQAGTNITFLTNVDGSIIISSSGGGTGGAATNAVTHLVGTTNAAPSVSGDSTIGYVPTNYPSYAYVQQQIGAATSNIAIPAGVLTNNGRSYVLKSAGGASSVDLTSPEGTFSGTYFGNLFYASNLPAIRLNQTGSSSGQVLTATDTGVTWSNLPAGTGGTNAAAVLTNDTRTVTLSNPTNNITGTFNGDFNAFLQGNSLLAPRTFPVERIIWRGSSTFIESSPSYISTESLVLTIMNRFKTNLLFQLGYNTIAVCDGWWYGRNQGTGQLIYDPTNFPNGIRWLADTLHSNGFYLELYFDDKGVNTTTGPKIPAFDVADQGIISSENFSNDVVMFRNWGIDGLQWDNRRYDSGRARYNTAAWSYWVNTLYPSMTFNSYGSSLTNADWVATVPAGVTVTPDPYNGFPKVVTNVWNGVDSLTHAHKIPQWRANLADSCYFFGDDSGITEYIDWQEAASPFWSNKRPIFAMPKLSGIAVCPDFEVYQFAQARVEWTFAACFHQRFDVVGTAPFVSGLNPSFTNEILRSIQRDAAMNPPKRFWTSNSISAWYEHLSDGSTALFFWNRSTNDTAWSYPSIPLSLLGISTNSLQYVTDVFFGTNCYLANSIGTVLTNFDARLYVMRPSNTVYVANGATGVTLNGNPPPYLPGTVGQYAFESGQQNTASGIGSVVFGGLNMASGDWSAAIGRNNSATATDSYVLGSSSTAAGSSSVVLGNQNYAGGAGYNIAMGLQATVTGTGSVEINGGGNGPKTNSTAFKFQVDGFTNGVLFSDPVSALSFSGNAVGLTNVQPGAVTNAPGFWLAAPSGGTLPGYVVTNFNATAVQFNDNFEVLNDVLVHGNIRSLNGFTGDGSGLTNLTVAPSATNFVNKPITVSGTNVTINLAGYTTNNVIDLMFTLPLTNNLYIAAVTNCTQFAGKGFSVEVQQGGTYTLNYNTNAAPAGAATIIPPSFGQFITVPTNSTSSRMFLYWKIGSMGTNAYLLGQSPITR